MANKKSDVAAKRSYVNKLNAEGFQAEIAKSPADIVAKNDGETWYFESKMTHQEDLYFGAATQTEWAQAFKDPEHFRFVVVIADEADEHFRFLEYTPAAFMKFSTIPPFKVYFNIDFTGKQRKRSSGEKKAISLTEENFRQLDESYKALK